MWDKLVLLLNQTLQIYQALVQLSREKKKILITANPQALEKLTKQEEMLIIEAGKLEKLRQPLIKELAAVLGMAPNQTALSAFIKYADTQTATTLSTISEQITGVTGELTQLNKLNEKLIQQSLDFISYNINVLSQTTAESTYAPKGQTGSAKAAGRSILDTKA